jgi:hypothetical protein
MANLPDKPAAKLDQRLKEVHQSDLTEGRINQDFLEWLKTKGMTYLLVALLGLCAYLVWVRWEHSRRNYKAEAWRELTNAALPTSLEEVAQKYGDVGAVGSIARLNAAAELLRSVQMAKTLGADEATRSDLSETERTEYLDRADRLYRETLDGDDQSAGKTLLMVTALTGRAVVAESKGDDAKAKEFYASAATRAGDTYPELAAQSRKRSEEVGKHEVAASLPSEEAVQALQPKTPQTGESVQVEPWIKELIDAGKPDASP